MLTKLFWLWKQNTVMDMEQKEKSWIEKLKKIIMSNIINIILSGGW